ncbi:MAG: DUF2800 domain-containing protein [Opitutae bacterium]
MNKTIRPSALPALNQCVCFESDDIDRDYSEIGTQRHKELERRLNKKEPDNSLDQESNEAIQWAVEYINMTCNGELKTEKKLSVFCGKNHRQMTGTCDVVDSYYRNIWDFKWRYRDYSAQMAAYALGVMQENWTEDVTIHVLFGEQQNSVKYNLTYYEAEKIVNEIVYKVEAGGPPTPCDYCNWCGAKATCPALVERVQAIQAGREDWELDNYHGSQIDNPEEMGKALTLAREVKSWIEGIEYHAKRLAEKNGGLPGFKLQTRKGKASITNIPEACKISTIPPQEFLALCSVSVSKIIDAVYFANQESYTSKAAAKRAITNALESVTERGKDSISLVKDSDRKTN